MAALKMSTVQAPQWTEFLSCPICFNVFNESRQRPISLACGHTVCKACLEKLQQKKCPFDQNLITRDINELPVNFALLQLVGVAVPEIDQVPVSDCPANDIKYYNSARRCIEELAMYLKPVAQSGSASATPAAPILSRPMQRKLVILVSCQLIEEEGRARAMRAARSLGERSVTELILQHQNPQQLSANLWAAVRARGCQFLGPAMQEEVLKLILLALEDGSALSRKVLVLFVVQRLESQYPQASKTAIGHVVQLLYRASCFKVTKREEESSLMQLKEEFRTYEALRREHDSQIVQIATEAGLRISPDQWSSLLYGDTAHKSHMQSIIDKLQTPQSFSQSVSELVIALQRSGDPGNLSRLRPHLELLAYIDPSPETPLPSWENLDAVIKAARTIVQGLVEFVQTRCHRKPEPLPLQNAKYKTSMCRDLAQKGSCPRGANCTFAHSPDEMERYRARNKKLGGKMVPAKMVTSSALTPREKAELAAITRSTQDKLQARNVDTVTMAPTATVAPTVHTNSSNRPLPSACQSLIMNNSTIHLPNGETRCIIISEASTGVSVPVARPQLMPVKMTSLSHTIYTSPTPTQEESSPTTFPITHRAPACIGGQPTSVDGSCRMSPPSEPHPIVHPVPHAAHSRNPNLEQEGMQCPGTYYTPAGHTPTRRGSTSSGTSPVLIADEGVMKSTVSMPLNPYTVDRFSLPTWDSHNYLTTYAGMHSQGKSPSRQLEELQQRRSELMTQLSITKRDPLAVDPQNSRGKGPTHAVYANYESGQQTFVGKSVADSMATSLSTMSLAKQDLDSVKVTDNNTAPVSTYVPWSCEDQYQQGSEECYIYEQQSSGTGSSYEDEDDIAASLSLLSFQSTGTSYQSTSSEHMSCPTPPFGNLSSGHPSINLDDPDDEFIPFEHTMVSKYGPISRMAKAKMKNSSPVQVTAAQPKDTTPVTAVTPLKRPFPITAQVPSRFQSQLVTRPGSDHIADPTGLKVASSLPTALMQPSVIAASSKMDATMPSARKTLWEKVLNMPGLDKPAAASTAEREQLRHELKRLNLKIENLQLSEDERLARELQAIELNIQETERQLNMKSDCDRVIAKRLQEQMEKESRKKQNMEQAKKKQEEMDRQYAEKLVLDEAREKGICMVSKHE